MTTGPPPAGSDCIRRTAHPLHPPIARRYVRARQLGEKVGRDLRGVGERLVVHGGKLRHHRERVRGGDLELGVFGAEMAGDRCRMLRLVERGARKPDRERADRAAAAPAINAVTAELIDASREKCPERNVGHHLSRNGIAEKVGRLRDRLGVGHVQRMRDPVGGGGRRRPVAGAADPPVGRDDDVLARQDLFDIAVDRIRCRHVAEPQEARHR